MNLHKVTNRDRKIQRRKNGHQEDGRSVFTIKEIQKNKALKIKKNRKAKQELLEGD